MDDGARDGPDVVVDPVAGVLPPIADPREVLDRFRAGTPRPVGWQYLEQLVAEEHAWFTTMIARVARVHSVEADDLHQEVLLGLHDCDAIQLGRRGLRRWLERRARWKAGDMLRGRRAGRIGYHDPERLGALAAEQEGQTPARSYLGGVANQNPWIGPDWNLQRLRSLGLTRDMAQVVLLVMWGLDVSLKEFAELADLSYDSVRKQKERGLKVLHAAFGLTPEEDSVMRAVRKHGSAAAAAEHLRMTAADVAEALYRAMARIERVLDTETRGDSDVD
ncbi:sigma-70 family RNA polymerase sigma factor [Pseudonocardia sp.]|uniref:sigma-70 family RNA polymerase sigma factor n=1 Tax=Pseudonocardia sp. TaxID=60912 RepID=UPI003D0EF117